MIDVKILTKAKDTGSTSGSGGTSSGLTTTGTTYTSVARSAKWADKAGYATSAGSADTAAYATAAGTADEATHAASAAALDADSPTRDDFLSAINADEASGFIQFLAGIGIGAEDSKWQITKDGIATLYQLYTNYIYNTGDMVNSGTITTKDLTVTGLAHFFQLQIDKLSSVAGAQVISNAHAKVKRVVWYGTADDYAEGTIADGCDSDADGYAYGDAPMSSFYACRLLWPHTDDDGLTVSNDWVVGDGAACWTAKDFTAGTFTDASNKFWWVKVGAVGEVTLTDKNGDETTYNYIDVLGADVAENGDYYAGYFFPSTNDAVAQLGFFETGTTYTAAGRGNAIILSAYPTPDLEIVPPSIVQYYAIATAALEPYRRNVIAKNGNVFRGSFYVTTAEGDEGTEIQSGNDGASMVIAQLTDASSYKSDLATLQGYADNQTTLTATISNASGYKVGDVAVVPCIISDRDNTTGQLYGTVSAVGSSTITFTAYSFVYGAKGETGNDGKGISKTTVTYQVSDSGTDIPTGTWQSSVPSDYGEGDFLWTRTVTTYTSGSDSTTTYSVSHYGEQGAAGLVYRLVPVDATSEKAQYTLAVSDDSVTQSFSASLKYYVYKYKGDATPEQITTTSNPAITDFSVYAFSESGTEFKDSGNTKYLTLSSISSSYSAIPVFLIYNSAIADTRTVAITNAPDSVLSVTKTAIVTGVKNADSISTLTQTAEEIQLKVENTVRPNMLYGTRYMSYRNNKEVWGNLTGTGSFSYYEDCLYGYYEHTENTSVSYIDLLKADYDEERPYLTEGEYYTLSFYAYGSVSSTSVSLWIYDNSDIYVQRINSSNGDGESPVYTGFGESFTLGTSWARYWITFKVTSGSGYKRVLPIRLDPASQSSRTVYFAAVKLENGFGATAWTDTTEDKLLPTGIDITSGKIVATADNFVIQNNSGTTTFSIDENGNLQSSGDASFSGKITATSGSIGGFTISDGNLSGGTASLEGIFRVSAASSTTPTTSGAFGFNLYYLSVISSATIIGVPDGSDQIGKIIRLFNPSTANAGNYYLPLGSFTYTSSGSTRTNYGYIQIRPQETLELACFKTGDSSGEWRVISRFSKELNEITSSNKQYDNRYLRVGRFPRVLAMGKMTFNSTSSLSLSGSWWTGATLSSILSVSRSAEGTYTITFSTSNVPDGYFVMVNGFGLADGVSNAPLKATVYTQRTTSFTVKTSDDATPNDGSFQFIIFAPDWESPSD